MKRLILLMLQSTALGLGEVITNFERITINPKQMGGVPCIHGPRIPVDIVVGMVTNGMTYEEILTVYPALEPYDIC